MSKKILTILLSILMLLTTMNFSGFVIAEDEKSTVLTNESVSVEGILPDGTELNANYVTFGINPAKGSIKKAASRGTDEHLYDLFIDNNTLVTIDSVIAAYDIKLVNNGENVQPNGKVKVTIDDVALNEGNDVRVVHVFDNATAIISAIKEGRAIKVTNPAYVNQFTKEARIAYEATGLENVVYVEVFKSEEGQVEVGKQSVSFETDSFSIFIIGEQHYERLKVNFIGEDKSTIIKTMYVKMSDKNLSDEEFAKIVYDPGIGSNALQEGKLFRGWSIDNADYTTTSEANTIQGVRSYLKSTDFTWQEGDELNVYAMVFKVYTVSYLDKKGIALGSDAVILTTAETEADYTVNMAYTPISSEENFDGWLPKDASNASHIVGYTDGTEYLNEDEIKITGNVIFVVNAPLGHWLVFDENGRGGTYNAPQFVESGEVTQRPRPDDEMNRLGYEFGGWYTEVTGEADAHGYKQVVEGTEFTFGNGLDDKVTVYAKWSPVSTASYTIIIWKQNVTGDGWDFAESKTTQGTVNHVIDTVSQQDTGNNAYAIVDGSSKRYEGFHLKEYDQNVTIEPEGTSILNVYYDRNLVTLTFQVYSTQGKYEQ
ncbi:MAG: InlB B-repeat-containing protein, partial [Erysipelotrichaceae bacterium]|nr:InlB B-repeat-containing protein [Erysipelotrichaceae bacterium]